MNKGRKILSRAIRACERTLESGRNDTEVLRLYEIFKNDWKDETGQEWKAGGVESN